METPQNTKKLSLKNFSLQGAKKKLIITAALSIAAVLIFAAAMISHYPKKSKKTLSFEENVFPEERLSALNKNAVSGKLKEKEYAFFEFSEIQKNNLKSFYAENGQAALCLRLGIKSVSYKNLLEYSEKEKPLYFGFLYDSDFDKKGKFTGDINGRILGGADLRNFIEANEKKTEKLFDFSIALEKNLDEKNFPRGFLIYSSLPSRLEKAKIENARIGYDLTEEIKFFGLASNGGLIGEFSSVDFTGASAVFPSENSMRTVMPKISVVLSENQEFQDSEQDEKIYLNAGGEVLSFYRFKDKKEFTLQASLLSNPFSKFSVSEKNSSVPAQRLSKLLMTKNERKLVPEERNKILEPLETEPGLVPLSRKNDWRSLDYEVYKWEGKENILIFDTKDYNVQSDFFTRLAFFTEKAGYRGRILSDEELRGKHGYNAHDYSAESLADFFTKAEELENKTRNDSAGRVMKSVLNEKETTLKEILLHNGIITEDKEKSESGRKYKAGKGAVISISQSSADYLRVSLCAHEIWHGLYFTDEDFRNTTAAIFYTIDSRAVDFLVAYWSSNPSLNYDSSDSYLIQNEFMAYIMQNPLSRVKDYFTRIAGFASSQRNLPEESRYIIETDASALEDAAKAFDTYVNDRWGLNCGRVSLVTKN